MMLVEQLIDDEIRKRETRPSSGYAETLINRYLVTGVVALGEGVKQLKQQNAQYEHVFVELERQRVDRKYWQFFVTRIKWESKSNDRVAKLWLNQGRNSDRWLRRHVGALVDLVNRFDVLAKRKKFDGPVAGGIMTSRQKDIGYWAKQHIDAFSEFIEQIETIKSRKEIKLSEADIIHKDKRFTVYSPQTHKASCILGSGTRWCISSRDDDYYDQYTAKGQIFAFVIDKFATDDDFYKVAVSMNVYEKSESNWEYYDAPDNLVGEQKLKENFGADNWDKLKPKIKSYLSRQEVERKPYQIWPGDVLGMSDGWAYNLVDYWRNQEYENVPQEFWDDVVNDALWSATCTITDFIGDYREEHDEVSASIVVPKPHNWNSYYSSLKDDLKAHRKAEPKDPRKERQQRLFQKDLEDAIEKYERDYEDWQWKFQTMTLSLEDVDRLEGFWGEMLNNNVYLSDVDLSDFHREIDPEDSVAKYGVPDV